MISFEEFKKRYPDHYSCAKKLLDLHGDECPKCHRKGLFKPLHTTTNPSLFFCNCGHQISVRKGTCMEKSAVQLGDWFLCMWMILNNTETPLKVIEKNLGVSHPTAVRMRKVIWKSLTENTLPDIFS